MRRQRGFTLLELLVVITIILIIAAVSIPNIVRNRATANEASALSSLRTLNSALVLYNANYGMYPPALISLQPPANNGNPSSAAADLIDQVLAGGTKAGYSFVYTQGQNGVTYTIIARPLVDNQTGVRHFYTDQSSTIRQNTGGDANASSTPLS